MGKLTALGADTAAGLRVLRGIGGEAAFFQRYHGRSQEVRRTGVRVALPQSTLDAAQVLIPGLFVVFVTWLGARFALSGKIDVGDLVAFYGYAAFLVIPLRTAAEAVDKITRSLVGAQKMLNVLRVEREIPEPESPVAEPPIGVQLADPQSGLVVEPGLLTCIVSSPPEEAAAIADRLGRFGHDDGAVLGDVRLAHLPVEIVRRRIVVSEATPFSSRERFVVVSTPGAAPTTTTRSIRRSRSRTPKRCIEALPDGLETTIDERGRSFSGGQRQRLVLARALLSDAELLVLVEPTSAVDAHTEARIAKRLRAARPGRTTVIVTTSPLVLDQADRVVFVEDGRVVAEGAHRELLRTSGRTADRDARGGPVSDLLPIADGPDLRLQARRLGRLHRRGLIGMVFLHALAATAGLAGPPLLGKLVQGVQGGTTTAHIDFLIMLLAAALVAQTILTFLARYASFVLSEKVFAELREDFMLRVLALPLSTVADRLRARGARAAAAATRAQRRRRRHHQMHQPPPTTSHQPLYY